MIPRYGDLVHTFESLDHFEIPGRGIVYAFHKSQIPEEVDDLDVLIGTVVQIDGANYKVIAIDAHPISEDDESTEPEDFGLMVQSA